MGNEIKSRPTVYMGVQGGYIQGIGKENIYNINPLTVGVQKDFKKGTSINAQVGFGTTLNANLGVSHNFKLPQNFGVEIGANASAYKALPIDGLTDIQEGSAIAHTVDEGVLSTGTPYTYQRTDIVSAKTTPGVLKLSADAKATYTTPNGKWKFGAGIEAGTRKNLAPKVVGIARINPGETVSILDDENKTFENVTLNSSDEDHFVLNNKQEEFFVSPALSFNGKLDKKGRCELFGNGNMKEGHVGIRISFR